MNRIYRILVLLAAICAANDSFGKSKKIIICFKLDFLYDSNYTPKLLVFEKFVRPLRNFNFIEKKFDHNGSYLKAELETSSEFVYLQLKDFDFLPVPVRDQLYLAEAGDSVCLKIKSNKISEISGVNISKWKYQMDLAENCNYFNTENANFDTDSVDVFVKDWIARMVFWKDSINQKAFQLLYVNTISKIKLDILSTLFISIRRYDTVKLKQAYELVADFYDKMEVYDSHFVINSTLRYTEYLFVLCRVKNELEQRLKGNRDFSTKSLFLLLDKRFIGELRDNLLVFYFLDIYRGDSLNQLKKALAIVSDKWSKNILVSIEEAKVPKKKAFNFVLEDTAGRVHKLEDFKGKVIVCKFWYRGCVGCVRLSYDMSSIVERYRMDSNIVFISINVDSDRSRWISGLLKNDTLFGAREKYSSDIDLNLSTSGYNHPMLNHYKYFAFPQLLIIDKKGYVVSANPSKPSNEQSQRQFINLIDNALHENISSRQNQTVLNVSDHLK